VFHVKKNYVSKKKLLTTAKVKKLLDFLSIATRIEKKYVSKIAAKSKQTVRTKVDMYKLLNTTLTGGEYLVSTVRLSKW
jgi:hypothetical protein